MDDNSLRQQDRVFIRAIGLTTASLILRFLFGKVVSCGSVSGDMEFVLVSAPPLTRLPETILLSSVEAICARYGSSQSAVANASQEACRILGQSQH